MAAAGGGGGAMGGAGGGRCSREDLLEPLSDKFITTKTREPALIAGNVTPHLFTITNRKACREYFQKRILIDNEIASESVGVYTWILKDIPGCGQHLFAIRTVIPQELGTLHNNLNEYTKGDKKNVIIAGELRINVDEHGEKSFEFNRLSGSFTESLSESIQDSGMAYLLAHAGRVGIAPARNIKLAPIINAEPRERLLLSSVNKNIYVGKNGIPGFCVMGDFKGVKKGGARRSRKNRRRTSKKLTRR